MELHQVYSVKYELMSSAYQALFGMEVSGGAQVIGNNMGLRLLGLYVGPLRSPKLLRTSSCISLIL